MSKCYICENEITKENETEEHIILNAIGGTLKSKKLICRKCNSELGNSIDAELANQLNFLSNLLNIKRSRDKNSIPNLEVKSNTTGDSILLKPGGKPIMKNPQLTKYVDENNQDKISIKAPNMKIARKMLTGLKRKYKHIDIDDALSKAKFEERYTDELYLIPVAIGGDKVFRSICKMAINFYIENNGSREYIKNLIPYIQGKKNSYCVQYYYKNIIPKNDDEILHSIIIKGMKDDKVLSAYIELFNFYKFVILLNDNYDGSDINLTYSFNVISLEETTAKYNNFYVSQTEISNLVKLCEIPTTEIKNELNNVLKIVYKKQENEFILNSLTNAKKNSFDKYSEDQVYTEEMGREFVDELMKQLTPWLANKLNHNNNSKHT